MSSSAATPLPFERIAVLGPGLLGGSIALAVQKHMPGCELRLWARRDEPLQLARRLGITPHTFRELEPAVRGAQLIILATPVGTFPALAAAIIPALSADAIITDVGSVKGMVHRTAGQLLTERGFTFIGSHPMAGGEKQGLEHARADLLQGATVALTNAHHTAQPHTTRLAHFWQQLGCRTCSFTPEEHDEAVARISHTPHILAALCARAAAHGTAPAAHLRQLASTGFRDTTRVSSGGAPMWADIIESNAPAIRTALCDCIKDMQQALSLLDADDKAGILNWLQQAGDARRDILQGRD